MGRKQKADETLDKIDKQLAETKAKINELVKQREAVEAERRKAYNVLVMNHIDTLLVFASHKFKECNEEFAYRNATHCPRCRLIEAKSIGELDDKDVWSISILVDTGC